MGFDPDRIGATLGPKIARIVADAAIYARHRSAPHTARLAVHSANLFLEQVTDEHQSTMSDLWEQIEATGEAPRWVTNAMGFLARGRGQWSALLGHAVTSAGVGQGIVPLVTNALNPAIGEIIGANPHGFLEPGIVAQAVARAIMSAGDGTREAAKSGINDIRFDRLVALARSPLAPDVVLDLARRRLVSTPTATSMLVDNGLTAANAAFLLATADQLLSPADLAAMVVRGIRTPAEATAAASKSGVPPADFADLVELSGDPPGLEQLLFLFRRGKIDRARLERGIRQSRVRTEWIDAVEALGTVPMSTDAAIAAVVQGELGNADGKRIATENGLDPDAWDTLVAAAGDPISRTEALELFNRGQWSKAQVEQAIRESRTKNKYVDDVLLLARRLPPQDAIGTALRHGAISEHDAIALIRQQGYNDADARMIVDAHRAEAKAPKLAHHAQLAAGYIRGAYVDGLLPRAQALADLAKLSYEPDVAAQLLDLADRERTHRDQMAEAAVHRAHFLAHKLTADEALGKLTAAGVDHATATRLVEVWTREVLAAPKALTAAQLAGAAAAGFIPGTEALARLQAAGYTDRDAVLFLLLHRVPPAGLPTAGITLPAPTPPAP